LYWKVLNAKHHGVPQNRERVFLIGIRDDKDNSFQFPKEEHLIKRLKDVLEDSVDDKYFLSENTIDKLVQYDIKQKENGNGFGAKFHDVDGMMSALKVGGGGCDDLIKIKSATSKGYEEAHEGDSINFSVPSSETRRGRVGKGVAQTLDTGCNQATIIGGKWNDFKNELGDKKGFEPISDGCSPTLLARARNDGSGMAAVSDGFKIRRLTPRECFRLMDFPDTFTWKVSDSQAYKQAGNSIVVNVLYKILKQLPL
jgi:DNA (cytosine-5)-methyltransferase 1